MDIEQRQGVMIEFLLFEGLPGDEIAQRLHDVYDQDAYYRASVFPCFNGSKRFAAATKIFAMKDIPEGHVDTTSMPPSGQFYKTRRTECFVANNRGDLGNLARDGSYRSHLARIAYTLKTLR
jgi:hypothetical protein